MGRLEEARAEETPEAVIGAGVDPRVMKEADAAVDARMVAAERGAIASKVGVVKDSENVKDMDANAMKLKLEEWRASPAKVQNPAALQQLSVMACRSLGLRSETAGSKVTLAPEDEQLMVELLTEAKKGNVTLQGPDAVILEEATRNLEAKVEQSEKKTPEPTIGDGEGDETLSADRVI